MSLDATFAALADPTRRAILERLATGDRTVTSLADPFAMSLPAISKHLRVLEQAGLLVREKEGRVRRCALTASPLKDAEEWIARYRSFWETQFGRLADYLSQTEEKEATSWPRKSSVRTRRSNSHARSPRRGRKSSGRGPQRKP